MVEAQPLKSQFYIDETVVETRLAHLHGGRLVGLWHWPHFGQAAEAPRVGDEFLIRIKKLEKNHKGAFVDMGAGREGFLKLGKKTFAEGSLVLARVIQAARRGKNPVLSVQGGAQSVGALHNVPGLMQARPDAITFAARLCSAGDCLFVDGHKAWLALQASAIGQGALAIELKDETPGLFERSGIEAQIEAALQPVVPLPSGGRLVVEETEAATIIDVDVADGGGADKVNIAAAREVPMQIAARQCGGTVLIDFAQINRAGQMKPLIEELKRAAEANGVALEVGVYSRSGLLELLVPRQEAPLSEVLTQGRQVHLGIPMQWSLTALCARLANAVRIGSARQPGALLVRVDPMLLAHLTGPGQGVWQVIVQATSAPLELACQADYPEGMIEVESKRGRTNG